MPHQPFAAGPSTRRPATTDIDAIALLDEPVRGASYDWVIAQGRPVGRDEVAAAVGVSRSLAAFHLDRLAEAELLSVSYRRLSGRTGPGAGRPAKLYARGEREMRVSLPERRYDVAASIMADTIEAMCGMRPPDALRAAAHRVGQDAGAAARQAAGPHPSRARRRQRLLEALLGRGYEPREIDGEIRFGNCPFHALVADHRDLVCGMNLALAEGVLDGLGDGAATARLDQQPGLCCVAIDLT
jgi:predicted ArsR family transcriptional regulator